MEGKLKFQYFLHMSQESMRLRIIAFVITQTQYFVSFFYETIL